MWSPCWNAITVSEEILVNVTPVETRVAMVAGAMALIYLLFGQLFVDGLTTAGEVRAAAADYLYWVVVIPFACVGAFLFDGVFIGTTFIREMRNAMAASAAVWGIVLYVCLPIWGYHAIWIAMIAFMAARSLMLWGYYGRIEAAAAGKAPQAV